MKIGSEKLPLRSAILIYVIFVPLIARNLFPIVRDKVSISVGSSLSDPQILATYFLLMYLIYVIFRVPVALGQIIHAPLWPFTLFVLVCFVSVFVSAFPLLTAWRSVETSLVLVWGALLLSMPQDSADYELLFRKFYLVSSLMLAAVVIGSIVDPQHAWAREAHVERLMGSNTFMMGSNTLGVIAAVLSVAALGRYLMSFKLLYLVASLVTLSICFAAHSRAGFIVFIVDLILLIMMLVRVPNRSVAIMLLPIFSVVSIAGLVLTSPEFIEQAVFLFTRGYDAANLSTLDGRTQIWEAGWLTFQQSPIIGYGYSVYPKQFGQAGHFHNLFIEILVTTGIAGMVPFLILTGWLVVRLMAIVFSFPRIAPEYRTPYMDAVIIGVGILVSNLATAAVSRYSWDLIGLILVVVCIHRMKVAQMMNSNIGIIEPRLKTG